MARILLVEDDEDITYLVSFLLTNEQHTVESIADGNQASEKLRASQYDLVILDWDLPGIRGVDVCRDYRAAGGTAPIIMLTGRGTIRDKELAFDIGADDYLVKPFEPKELSSRIKALLRRAPVAAPQAPSKTTQLQSNKNFCKACGGYFADTQSTCPTDGTPLIATQVRIDELVGTTIGDRYQVLALIASGGMAVVYQAWHKFLNRLVAIKLLHTRFLDDPLHLRRFQLEAQSVSALKHPNIISMLDFGMMGTQPYLVMDFVHGSSLADILCKESQVDATRAVRLFIQVCHGIDHAHANGIIHRDLKPSNLMIEQAGDRHESVKVVDFGVAKILPQSGQEVERLTKTGECFGTSYYMSPEQCMGRGLDRRSDIYSLGCIMYETLTGQPPFVGDNALDTIQKHLHEPTTPLSTVGANLRIPSELEVIVLKALEKDPARRYQSIGELRHDLEAISQRRDGAMESH